MYYEQLDRPEIIWRRTADGWERVSDWERPPPREPSLAAVHPILVAALLLMLSLAALLAFPPRGNRRRPDGR
jgi:hypothetical protein